MSWKISGCARASEGLTRPSAPFDTGRLARNFLSISASPGVDTYAEQAQSVRDPVGAALKRQRTSRFGARKPGNGRAGYCLSCGSVGRQFCVDGLRAVMSSITLWQRVEGLRSAQMSALFLPWQPETGNILVCGHTHIVDP